jgi:ATP-dependent DNA helicase RecG
MNKLNPQSIKLVEQVGSGIGRMKDVLKEARLPVPEFRMEGMFTVVFHRIITEKSSGKTSRDKIIEQIRNNPSVTTKELAELVGITDKGIEYQLSKLQKEGVLTRKRSKNQVLGF